MPLKILLHTSLCWMWKENTLFVHVVLFWLKSDAPADAAVRIISDCNSKLSKITTVKHLWAGEAVVSPREVVDSSYQAGLCVVFESQADHDIYQEHELHKEFIEDHNSHWERVQVYDFS